MDGRAGLGLHTLKKYRAEGQLRRQVARNTERTQIGEAALMKARGEGWQGTKKSGVNLSRQDSSGPSESKMSPKKLQGDDTGNFENPLHNFSFGDDE